MAIRQPAAGGKSSTLPRNMGSKSTIPTAVTPRGRIPTPPVSKKVGLRKPGGQNAISSTKGSQENKRMTHSIRSCDTKLAQLILDEIIEGGSPVTWEDVSGQEVRAKKLAPCNKLEPYTDAPLW